MKNTRRILSFLLVMSFCLALTFTLMSCGQNTPPVTPTPAPQPDGGTDNKITYTVTVTDVDGAAVEGVKMMISDGSSVFKNAITGANGKATVELDAANTNLGVMITSVPEEYVKPVATSGMFNAMFGANKELSFRLEKATTETITYTVKIVDQFNEAVAGVEIQICHSVCVTCNATDANGQTTKELSASVAEMTLKVGILDAPDNYTIPEATVEGGYHAVIEPGETEITIQITKN